MTKILLIEDDVNLAFMLADGLEEHGFSVVHEPNGDNIVSIYNKEQPDIILLDVDLGEGLDGFSIAEKIRKISNTLIVFATGKTTPNDLKKGFRIGNMDYIKKPYTTTEVVLHINDMLQRNLTREEIINYRLGEMEFIPVEHTIYHSRTAMKLPKNENKVLEILCRNKNNVVSKNEIVEYVWGGADFIMKDASLHNIISSLRSKLANTNGVSIETVTKEGYKLICER